MNDQSDQQLLRSYAESRSDESFALLVNRHVDLVYSAALRMVRDPHLAEDVTQSVFAALAKGAGQLTDRAVLSGWLHRTAQNIAVQTVRTIERRRAREQQSVAMNETLTGEPDASWDEIAPHLDAALNDLSEPDRDALFLRYFENKSAREMAQALGISEEAAQKRSNRAVERLRGIFSKNGIALGTGGIVGLLSVNAVQAAPLLLSTNISGALALTGSALGATATTTTVQIVAMTTLQKTLVATTVVLLAVAGVHENRKATSLDKQLRTMEAQHVTLSNEVQQLQTEREEASNQLVRANKELATIKIGAGENELLKLRGQVGTLRRQLGAVEAKANMDPLSIEAIKADPKLLEHVNQQGRREIKLRFADLFQELRLSPDQVDEFAKIYANSGINQQPGEATNSVALRLEALLGKEGFERFGEFEKEVPTRVTMRLLSSQLGANQLTDNQFSRLWQIVQAQPYEITYGIEGDMNNALSGSPEEVDAHLAQLAEVNQRIKDQAGAFLTLEQSNALTMVLDSALKARIAQAAVFARKP